MTLPAAIQANQVTKRFVVDTTGSFWKLLRADGTVPAYQALTNIDLAVGRGELVGLLGRNGAGKSTLLRTVGGIHTPDRGRVRVNGALAGLYELGIGGNDHLDGGAFTKRWLGIIGIRDRNWDEVIAEIREFSELRDAFDRPIRTYSSGMRARLFFAVATALPADVYVIDEMLAVGDEYFQNKCWRRLRDRLTKGASGLLATHDWSAILKLCATSYIIEGGQIKNHGPSPAMVRSYLGNSVDDLAPGAKFTTSLPDIFNGYSLDRLNFDVEIDVTEPGDVLFGASIERFVSGFGWEHLLHASPKKVVDTPGRHWITVSFPTLRLPATSYVLALFLVRITPSGQRLTCDVRSWTHGNPLTLDVKGAPSRGAVRLPLSVEVRTKTNAE